MKNTGTFRLGFLLGAIARMIANPLGTDKYKNELNSYRRQFHYMSGAENPIYTPPHKKLKGWQKEAKRKKHYNKFK